ncbi:AraC family transcriptional regulator [Martelella radicis]|uniref:AraC-like DNA-binding protein n=1 Tax=Martelella radicis TaxID=1397476 RepID=A0A7W6PCT6_9HYPH|nr:AraC family transcriptional regulator [Martelella radicis]MBB4124059.1 AraC-like DNA-binding protein [Martelella radicis]
MSDPLADLVSFLQPRAPYSKWVTTAGPWLIHREQTGQVFYCLVLEGAVRFQADGREAVTLRQGDFVLVPSSFGFTSSSVDTRPSVASTPVLLENGALRLGRMGGPAESQYLVGHCVFGAEDASLLVSLLPEIVIVRREDRLAALAKLVREETLSRRPARDVVLERLLEVLFIEALRSTAACDAAPGLLRGLGDARLAEAIRAMHRAPERNWTVAELADLAVLSRSSFFARFSKTVGVPPMEYLFAWRMALAKKLLAQGDLSVAAIAERVGYGSSSAFSLAFTRHSGLAPAHFARAQTRVAAE